jgi:integrase
MRTPSLRRHSPSSLGVVTLNGKDHYLGHWPKDRKTPPAQVQTAYDRLIAEWLAKGRRLQPQPEANHANAISLNELMLAFLHHAELHYRREDGSATSELNEYKAALKPLKRLYGALPVTEFGPLKLKAVREAMAHERRYLVRFTPKEGDIETKLERHVWEHNFRRVVGGGCQVRWLNQWCDAEVLGDEQALSRGVINNRIRRIVRMLKWAVAEELAPESVWRSLTTVRGLEKGRTTVRETEKVKPVPEAHVLAVLPYASPQVAAMLELQLLTGARPVVIRIMRARDIDTSSDIWLYRPAHHKTRYKGKERVIAIGPRGQEVIKPFLKLDLQAHLFSPRDAVAHFRAMQRANRKTPVQPSQMNRKKRKPLKQPTVCYTMSTYATAVAKACIKAAVPHFHPHQVRHTHATSVRRQFGLEAAQVALGHSQAQITEVYAERDQALAAKVAKQIG